MPRTPHNPDRPRLSASSSGAQELGRVLLKPEDATDRNLLKRESRGKCNPMLISFTPLPNLHHLRQRIFLLLISPVSLVCRYPVCKIRQNEEGGGGGSQKEHPCPLLLLKATPSHALFERKGRLTFPTGPSLRAKGARAFLYDPFTSSKPFQPSSTHPPLRVEREGKETRYRQSLPLPPLEQ